MNSCTLDIINKYCENKIEDLAQRSRTVKALARPSLFAEEERLQKCFFDFSEEELEQYFLGLCHSNIYNGEKKLSQTYVRWLLSYYRDLFRFYMVETGHYFLNPLEDRRFRSLSGMVKDDMSHFTKGTLERLSLSIEEHFEPGEAEFTNLLLWLFYSGAFSIQEVVDLKEDDVDLASGVAFIENRTIHLKEECIDLLRKNHEIEEYKIHHFTNLMMPYQGSYIWFPYREVTPPDGIDSYSYAYEQHQSRSVARVRDIVNKKLAKVREACNVFVKPDLLYYRGIYDYIISQCGFERTKELLLSDGGHTADSMRNADEFQAYLKEYGARLTNKDEIYIAKGNLRAFLPE